MGWCALDTGRQHRNRAELQPHVRGRSFPRPGPPAKARAAHPCALRAQRRCLRQEACGHGAAAQHAVRLCNRQAGERSRSGEVRQAGGRS